MDAGTLGTREVGLLGKKAKRLKRRGRAWLRTPLVSRRIVTSCAQRGTLYCLEKSMYGETCRRKIGKMVESRARKGWADGMEELGT